MPLFKHSDKSSFGLDIKFLHNSSETIFADIYSDTHLHRQTDRQMNRQTHTYTVIHIDTHTHTHTHTHTRSASNIHSNIHEHNLLSIRSHHSVQFLLSNFLSRREHIAYFHPCTSFSDIITTLLRYSCTLFFLEKPHLKKRILGLRSFPLLSLLQFHFLIYPTHFTNIIQPYINPLHSNNKRPLQRKDPPSKNQNNFFLY